MVTRAQPVPPHVLLVPACRATSQWFASVEGFKAASLEAIRQVGGSMHAWGRRVVVMTTF